MAVKLAFNELPQFIDANGDPYNGGQLFTYVAGSSTKQTTYQDDGGVTQNSNPIVLNSAGRTPYPVWLTTGVSYKFVLAPANDTDPPASPIWTLDDITGINDTSVSIDQWVTGPAPTYISATSFSLVGDQTSTFTVGRRIKTTNSGGTVYSTITASAYGALTTVTVANDGSGVLDAGLSAVSYGLLTSFNLSIPRGIGVTVAAHASTMNPWVAGEVLLSGSAVTFTDFADAPYVGAVVWLKANAAHTFTNSSPLTVQGGANYTCASGDYVRVRATAVDAFDLTIFKANGAAVGGITLSVPQASTSGTSIDFTGIPAGTKRITINFSGVGTNGTGLVVVQIGDSGGIENANYFGGSGGFVNAGAATVQAGTASILLEPAGGASSLRNGSLTLSLENSSAFTWCAAGNFYDTNSNFITHTACRKSLSAELDRVRITTSNGTDTFDAGEINIFYER